MSRLPLFISKWTKKRRTILLATLLPLAVIITYVAISFDINHILPENLVLLKMSKVDVAGIDVSHHQGNIDWKKVKKAKPDLEFVYVKCTEGRTHVDSKFIKNVSGASEQGYKVGAYHYFRMTSSAQAQFRNFKAQMDKVHLDMCVH